MENTQGLASSDSETRWYVAQGSGWLGPLTALEICQKLLTHEISLAHFICRENGPWLRLFEEKVFSDLAPPPPPEKLRKEIQSEARKKAADQGRIWFLHHQDSQIGPFSEEEVMRLLQSGQVQESTYAWKSGMSGWKRLKGLKPFEKAPIASPKEPMKKSDQRRAPRRPLVAKILMAQGEVLGAGLCRDLSLGGMQVLTDRLPGAVGTRIKINVNPAPGEGKAVLEPFVAEGVVVRILEDGRGFSFRFEKLNRAAQNSIERYLNAPAVS